MKAVATIGSFDGVHRGHQCLLHQVRHIADERKMDAVAITFGTSPKRVLGIDDALPLNSVEERVSLLRRSGMDEVEVLDFTPQLASMSARDFMKQVLKEQYGIEVLVIGYDHRFGRGRQESFPDYVRYGQEIGIEVIQGDACTDCGGPISSTRIRHLLTEGEVEGAAQLLGYQYTLQGEVVDGYKEGRKMGFPTANIAPQSVNKLIPADGVYAVWVVIEETYYKGMLNIGYRPTLNNGRERSIEVHVLDFEGRLYGTTITIKFAHRLREERTFVSLEELTEQLRIDRDKVNKLLKQS